MGDGEKVFSKFLLWGAQRLIENHEFDAMGLKDPVKQFESESTQSVSVGNHHFRDVSFEDLFQNPTEALAFEVDATADVRDDSVVRVLLGHEGTLTFEVILLTVGGDPTVTVFGSGIVGFREIGIDVIESRTPRGPYACNDPLIRPSAEGLVFSYPHSHYLVRHSIVTQFDGSTTQSEWRILL